jgi:hypothetical protein
MATLATRLTGWFAPAGAHPIEPRDLRKGATFARMTRTQVTETARILGIAEDEGGIAHVRYASRLHRADRTLDQGQRTLALLSFLKRFDPLPQRGASSRAQLDGHGPRLP